jgi:Ca2+/Na+ antiporter
MVTFFSGLDSIKSVILWQNLLLGLICGFVSALLFPENNMPKLESPLRHAVHFLLMTAIVMLCGYLFGWYYLSLPSVLLMLGSVAVVYAFVYFSTAMQYRDIANKINKELEERDDD